MIYQPYKYLQCDAVILAGGKATRMGGCNKLLQCFDGQCKQLEKLRFIFKPQVQRLWINSHRDHEIYQAVDRSIGIFKDIETGFFGPMMGMISAWLYSEQDWILFIPCDIYHVPDQLLAQMMHLVQTEKTQLCYAEINDHALYPLCLMHRSMHDTLMQHFQKQQYSLYRCFEDMTVSVAKFQLENQHHHSINAWSELQSLAVCS